MKRPIDWREDRSAVREKVAESAHCVLPIVLIVVLLCLTAAPMKPDLLLSFLIGGVMLVVGMGLFSLGAEQSMTPIGTKIGTALTRTKNLPLILGVSFALGFAITVAEPDLQVLAETVPHISSTVLLLTVGVGVGLFMAVCMLRIVTGANLRWLLLGCYALIFLLAAFSDPEGAFYMMVKAPGGDAHAFSERAKKENLLLVPADSFGCPGFFRISTCVDPAMIQRSLPAFRRVLQD